MFKLKKRGLTLIELLITLGIISVVFTTIFSLFITNYKSLNKSQLEVELQSEAQKSVEKITNKVLQVNKISELKNISNNSKVKDSAEVIISSISFDDKAYGFSLNNDKLIDENNNEIARNVKEIKIKPVPENSKFEDATGIKFNVKFEKGGVTKEIETEVSFRNYGNEYVIDMDKGNNENGGNEDGNYDGIINIDNNNVYVDGKQIKKLYNLNLNISLQNQNKNHKVVYVNNLNSHKVMVKHEDNAEIKIDIKNSKNVSLEIVNDTSDGVFKVYVLKDSESSVEYHGIYGNVDLKTNF